MQMDLSGNELHWEWVRICGFDFTDGVAFTNGENLDDGERKLIIFEDQKFPQMVQKNEFVIENGLELFVLVGSHSKYHMCVKRVVKSRMVDVDGGVCRCPQCEYPQYCGCSVCVSQIPVEIMPYVWDESGELISCANCGYTLHVDGWLSLNKKLVTKCSVLTMMHKNIGKKLWLM